MKHSNALYAYRPDRKGSMAAYRPSRLASLIRGAVILGVATLGALCVKGVYENNFHEPPQIQYSGWNYVFATREGLTGHRTATGRIIRPEDEFAALPSGTARKSYIQVAYRDRIVEVPVCDVGPHNITDRYWAEDGVPRAAKQEMDDFNGIPQNPAGIDLSDGLFKRLGLRGNEYVAWRFTGKYDSNACNGTVKGEEISLK